MSSGHASSHALTQRLLRALISLGALVGIGIVLYAATIMWAGSAETLDAVARVTVFEFAVGTLVASSAYLVRFARWHALLLWLGNRLPAIFNLRVYLSGLALTSSPGKLGETVRSVLLLPRGVRLPQSLAAFFADRLSDVIGVALLGSLAGWTASHRQPVLDTLAIVILLASLLAASVLRSATWHSTMSRADRRSYLGRVVVVLSMPATAWAGLWTMPRVLLCTACAFLAYGMQALVFAAYVSMMGAPLPTAQCVAIFASSTLIGAASMIPGGLGAVEASLVYQLMEAGFAMDGAVAAAFLIVLQPFGRVSC